MVTGKNNGIPVVHDDVARILNAIGRAAYLKSIDDRIVLANDDFGALFGMQPEHVLSQRERELFGHDISEVLAEGAARLLTGMQIAVQTELSVTDSADTPHMLDVTQQLFQPEDGDPLVLVMMRDVTEERHLEEVLKASEEYARSFLESSRDCIAHLSLEGSFLHLNAAGANLLGLERPEDSVGMLFESICLDGHESLSVALHKAISFEPAAFEQKIRGASGELWLDVRLTPIRDIDGSVRSILLVGRDITEQRRAEAEVRKLLRAVEQNPASIVITDTNGWIEYVNPKFCEVSGYRPDEAIGQNPRILKSGEKSPEEYRDLWAVIKDGREWRGEFHNRKKNGELFWEAASISPIRDAEGNVTHFIAVKEDITQRKVLEGQLQAEKQHLEQAYADLQQLQSQLLQQEKMSSIGQLAAGVAHEINNPMGFIMSNLNTLKKYVDRLHAFIDTLEGALGEIASGTCLPGSFLEAIRKERASLKIDYIIQDAGNLLAESSEGAERVKRIVQDLKGFSRIDEAASTTADINAGLESTINIVWNEIKYKAVVTKDFGTIPQTRCFPGQLNQVFMNLLINAAQAIPETGEISIRTWADSGNIFVSVTDTGTGIPPEKISRIFEPFFTTKDVGKGTGLGLSIAYDIVKKHDGEITVESEPGKGTSMTVRIPVVEG